MYRYELLEALNPQLPAGTSRDCANNVDFLKFMRPQLAEDLRRRAKEPGLGTFDRMKMRTAAALCEKLPADKLAVKFAETWNGQVAAVVKAAVRAGDTETAAKWRNRTFHRPADLDDLVYQAQGLGLLRVTML